MTLTALRSVLKRLSTDRNPFVVNDPQLSSFNEEETSVIQWLVSQGLARIRESLRFGGPVMRVELAVPLIVETEVD